MVYHYNDLYFTTPSVFKLSDRPRPMFLRRVARSVESDVRFANSRLENLSETVAWEATGELHHCNLADFSQNVVNSPISIPQIMVGTHLQRKAFTNRQFKGESDDVL